MKRIFFLIYGGVILSLTACNANDGYEYVDLGLPSGTLWATCNVGASNPEEAGDYFAWGETFTKENYHWDTYKYCKGSSSTLTKYCDRSMYGYNDFEDNIRKLEFADDAAAVNWGRDWRMPTIEEIEELLDEKNCTWELTTLNGRKGKKVTSKINGNSIFFPFTGVCVNKFHYDIDAIGGYWSAFLDDAGSFDDHSFAAYVLEIGTNSCNISSCYRYNGLPVRAVYRKNK